MIKQVLKINKIENQSKKRQRIHFAFFLLLFILVLSNMTSVTLAAVASPTSDFYVNDNAGVLTRETKQYIMDTNVELQKKTGAQIVVVTVKSLNGMSIEDYAYQLFNSWGIGDKNKDNGLLLLCSYGDREFRVEVGYGLEGKLPDGKTGRMQDEYIIPYLRQNNFDEGIRNGYSAFLKEVAEEYGVTITGSEKAVQKGTSFQSIEIIIYIMVMFFFIFISIRFRGRGGPFIFFGGGGGFHGGGFSGGGGFHGGGGHSGGGGSSRSF